jgi:streptogramin lyase
VFRDLRPYVCTHSNCSNPDKLYPTRRQWVYHEMQMHRRQWTCRQCEGTTFDSREPMEMHLRTNHAGSWTEQQFSILLDMSEGPLDETQILACPICPNELYLSRLLPHLADHMEEISLFVLPSVSHGDEDGDSQAMQAARTVDKTDMGSTTSDMSLAFSAPDARERPPEYQRILKELADSKPVDSLRKANNWRSGLNTNSWKPVTLSGHKGYVWSVCFAPHGRLLASGASDQTVRLWDPATGNPLQTLEGHTEAIISVVFSPDGKLLASGSKDTTVRLWDPTTGNPLQTLEGHTEAVYSVVFSPNGRVLASGSVDSTIRLWDPTTGNPLQTFTGLTKSVYSVAFSPDGRVLALGSMDNTIRLCDATTGNPLQTLGGHTQAVYSVVFSPDGRVLASGSKDATVRLWDLTTGNPLQTLEGHTETVYSVVFSPDGKLLASGSWDNKIRLWDPTTGSVLRTIEDHSDDVNTVAFSPDGGLIASGSDERIVRLHLVHVE